VEQESLVGQFDRLARMLLLCFGVAPCDIYPFEPKDPVWGTGHAWDATVHFYFFLFCCECAVVLT